MVALGPFLDLGDQLSRGGGLLLTRSHEEQSTRNRCD